MNRTSLNRDWSFVKGIPQSTIRKDYLEGERIDLPHDMQISQDTTPNAIGSYSSGYYEGCAGIYSRELRFPLEERGRRYVLEFDGCCMETEVRLNGQVVGRNHNGYTPFLVDLTEYIRFGEPNYLMVIADNSCQPNSRWYSGAGLYRHVDLRSSGPVFIRPWGLHAWTGYIEAGTAFVWVEAEIGNLSDALCDVRADIAIRPEGAGRAGHGEIRFTVPAGETARGRTLIAVPEARLWSDEDPSLYTVEVKLTKQGEVCDGESTVFGIRTISVNAVNGLMLNGKPLKLRGGCLHHDNGLLGAASFYASERRRLGILKENGYNAVRTAHNPPSRDFLEACDRIGLLVVDELFDCWVNGKRLNDYGKWFAYCWEGDLENSVKRDRNHPCVIMWSIGNEIVERGGLSHGAAMAARIAAKVRTLDGQRPVTSAINELLTGLDERETLELRRAERDDPVNGHVNYLDELWTGKTEPFAAALDVVGYNYLDRRYEDDARRWPARVMCGLESYPKDIGSIWKKVQNLPFVIGDFTWTCYDYIGEAGVGKSRFLEREPEGPKPNIVHDSPYPWRTANDADFDICGFPRPQAAFRRIAWGSGETCIFVQDPRHFGQYELLSDWGFPELSDSWTWPGCEGRDIRVVVMSRSPAVRLLQNGRPLGTKPCGEAEGYMAAFTAVYGRGDLVAESIEAGAVVSRATLRTAGAPTRIALLPEKTLLAADGYDLGFISVEIQDADGRRVPGCKMALRAEVQGAGTLAGFGSGAPITTDNYAAGRCFSHDGRALLIVRGGTAPGTIRIRVASDLGDAECTLEVRAPEDAGDGERPGSWKPKAEN